MSKGRKRAADICVEELFFEPMSYDYEEYAETEMEVIVDKRQKFSEQDWFEKLLIEVSSPKQRHFVIQDIHCNYKSVKLTEYELAELIFGFIISFEYYQAKKSYGEISENSKGELLQKVWDLAIQIQPISVSSNGFGVEKGFSSPGFGSVNNTAFNSRGFGASPILSDNFVRDQTGFSPKQRCISEILKKVRNLSFDVPILQNYLCEFKKRLIFMQLKETAGHSIEITNFAELFGFSDLSLAMLEIREIMNIVGWQINGRGVSAVNGLKENILDCFINTTNYTYIKI